MLHGFKAPHDAIKPGDGSILGVSIYLPFKLHSGINRFSQIETACARQAVSLL